MPTGVYYRPLSPRQRQLLSYLLENPTHGALRAARSLGWSETSAERRLRGLRKRGLITTPKPKNQHG